MLNPSEQERLTSIEQALLRLEHLYHVGLAARSEQERRMDRIDGIAVEVRRDLTKLAEDMVRADDELGSADDELRTMVEQLGSATAQDAMKLSKRLDGQNERLEVHSQWLTKHGVRIQQAEERTLELRHELEGRIAAMRVDLNAALAGTKYKLGERIAKVEQLVAQFRPLKAAEASATVEPPMLPEPVNSAMFALIHSGYRERANQLEVWARKVWSP